MLKNLSTPIIIKEINVLNSEGDLYVECISKDGAKGYIKSNKRMKYLLPILGGLVIPHFIDQDIRNLEELVDIVYTSDRNYKYAGMPFWNCVGHVEAAVLDMVGKTVNKTVGQLFGKVIREEVPVYLSRLKRYREPEEEVDLIAKYVDEYGFNAVKLKIGGRMSNDADVYPGYSEKLVRLTRETLGEEMTIYVDANGSYSPEKAIEVGKFLQEYNVAFFEEPCQWEDFVGTARVNQQLQIPVAAGEQESSLYKFEWMIKNKAVDIIQPDLMYNGGIIRSLRVAKMAEEAGLLVAPHNPKIGSEAAPLIHFISILENIGPYHEYKISDEVKNGAVKVPERPGLGVEIDKSKIEEATVVLSSK